MDKKYKSLCRDRVKKFKPWEPFVVEDFVDFEQFELTVKVLRKS
jgi:hypothetical protein